MLLPISKQGDFYNFHCGFLLNLWVYVYKMCEAISILQINLCMAFIVPPLPFIDRTVGKVKGPLSVPLTLNKLPRVLMAQGIL